jgi:hypothetical protein
MDGTVGIRSPVDSARVPMVCAAATVRVISDHYFIGLRWSRQGFPNP